MITNRIGSKVLASIALGVLISATTSQFGFSGEGVEDGYECKPKQKCQDFKRYSPGCITSTANCKGLNFEVEFSGCQPLEGKKCEFPDSNVYVKCAGECTNKSITTKCYFDVVVCKSKQEDPQD